MRLSTIFSGLGATSASLMIAGGALAQNVKIIGQPVDGKMGFQPAGTPVAQELQRLDGMMTYIMTGIVIFVTLLLLYVIFRFNSRANPTPAKFTHNTPLEITWTLVPILILVVIGSFSLPVLFKELEIPKADLTIKVTGNQWFWTYQYPDEGFSFDSFMLGKDELANKGYDKSEYLLAVDEPVVVPVGKTVVVQITGADVIHSWAVPAFGVKQDAVPGRLAEAWFKAEKEGVYFGQCSELCGKDHAYMPIEVKVVSQADYDKWLANAKKEFASNKPAKKPTTDFASAAPSAPAGAMPLRLASND
ncbi:cytochrome c oxidase subunit II [Acidimangrovimonas pyrenivorans]|uniref:Cytochrome c oxidase subunit 2 n=1 Tax=Acidimangrovimonas pyrenivorans TaxID=2030798 RepID=A0ABV7AK42_9RHOB